MIYERLPIDSDLSEASLEEAVSKVGPANHYWMYVHPDLVPVALELHKSVALPIREPELGEVLCLPRLHIMADPGLNPKAWYLAARGKTCGSEGAM